VEFGADLQAGRAALVAALQEPVASAYATVAAARNEVQLRYQPARIEAAITRTEFAQALQSVLEQVRAEELARAVTVVGPHRDELDLHLNALPARGYASHGESWSLALALRLASHQILRDEAAGDAILILDDVFAELDEHRRQRLAEVTAQAQGQVLVTAAVPTDVPNDVSGVTFSVDNGTVRKELM
jgi:DNA replication and repair protein RecF